MEDMNWLSVRTVCALYHTVNTVLYNYYCMYASIYRRVIHTVIIGKENEFINFKIN